MRASRSWLACPVWPILWVVLSSSPAVAATYYLAPGGDDKNPGSEASPWGTFPYAANRLQPGDTLLVRQGTYSWKMYTNIASGSSWAQAVTIKTYPGETATFQSPAGPQYIRLSGDRQYIIIEGAFVFDGVGPGLGLATYSRLKDAEVKNIVSTSVISGGGGHNEFINLHVHDNGKGMEDHGLYCHANANRIFLDGDTAKATAVLQNNLLDTDPLFTNAVARDFSLRPGSPAIDAGVCVKEVATDFAGHARPQGAAYDIGANEYKSPASTSGPAPVR